MYMSNRQKKPVPAYMLLSSPSNKQIVFNSSLDPPVDFMFPLFLSMLDLLFLYLPLYSRSYNYKMQSKKRIECTLQIRIRYE